MRLRWLMIMMLVSVVTFAQPAATLAFDDGYGPNDGSVRVARDYGPTQVYFPLTGQYLDGEFLEFFREYGGIPVFGYPVSDVFVQDGMTVQYFERSVMEVHPDNPPEWRVLLRRLGAIDATPEVRAHPAFDPSHEATTGQYFPPTQQNLQHGFYAHWQAHGGLRIFGYPISSEFDRDGLTIQYLERGVFEFHPTHPPEWRILQPRLGAQAAREDGVNTEPQPHDERVPVYHPDLWAPPPAPEPTNVVYLTFDDGPSDVWTPQILDILSEHNALATFFVLGVSANAHPGIVQDIAARGHTVANHSWDHTSMDGMSFAEFEQQVRRTEQVVGDHMAPCLRPPYGHRDHNTERFARNLGYEVVMWDIDPRDWEQPGANIITQRVVDNVESGDVVIFHDGGVDRSQTVQALGPILQQLSAQGYEFRALCN